MTTQTPAGWYPAPHAANQPRYWDGTNWHDAAPPAAPTVSTPMPPPRYPAGPPTPGPSKGLAIAALVTGIAAFLLALVPFVGFILAAVAVGLGVFALIKQQSRGLAITGTVLGGLALVASILTGLALVGLIAAEPTTRDRGEVTAPRAEAQKPSAEPRPSESATEEPAAPAPAQPTGTASDPLPQPYVAKGIFGGEKYSLTARVFSADANAQVAAWNMFNSEAPAGFKYVVIEMTMTGIDPDGVEPLVAAMDLSLATAEGNRYDEEFLVLGEGMPSMWDAPTLYPGHAFTGYTVYVVPAGATEFLLHDNGKYVRF